MVTSIPTAETLLPMVVGFLMITTRLGLLFLTAPLLSAKTVPKTIRAAMLMVVSATIYIALPPTSVSMDPISLVLALLGEAMVGAAAGLSASLVFAAVETAGQLLGIPMGMGFASAVDPMTQQNSVVTSRFLSIIASLVFLAMDVHLILIRLIAQSFIVLPPGKAVMSVETPMILIKNAALIFNGAVQLAAPVLIVLLGVMAAMGLLAKFASKVNLFVLSFAISIALGIVALRAAMPGMTAWIRNSIDRIEPLATEALGGF